MSTSNPANIGRYKVTDRLGQGGMGALYLAHDPVIDRMLAIKVLREGADSDELRARFAREARAAGRLSHPNIVTIFDVGEFELQPFIAMEFVSGESLETLIRRRVKMPLPVKLKLLEELCDGLAYAHRSGLVHRDIKPANLMVTSEGTLKILDFGIVRMAESGMTQTGMLVGTLPYMSPEQVGGKQVDHRSDIFSVGDVAYELLTYKQAFPGTFKDGIFERIMRSDPPPLVQLCPDLPEDLPPVVNRALAKEPEHRYQDLTAMRADLERVRQRLQQKEGGAGPARSEDATIVAGRGRRGPATTSGPSTPPHGTARESVTRRRAALIEEHLTAADRALQAGDPEKAITEAEGAALLDPYEERAQKIIDRATAAIEERELQGLLNEARDHLTKGEPTLAAGLVERALAKRPDYPDALTVQRSVDDLRRELELARERAQIVRQAIERSRAALDNEAFDTAIRAADEALVRQPEHPEALDLKREATARRDERRKIEEHDRAAEAAVAEARTAFQQQRYDAALAGLERFAPPHPLVSQTLDALRRDVEEIHRREAEAKRQKIAALTAAARQAADAGRYDEAHGLAARIRELEPASDAAQTLIRDIARRKAEAEEAARRAVIAAEAASRAREAFERKDLAVAQREVATVLDIDATHADALALRDQVEERRRIAAAHRQAAAAALTGRDPATVRTEIDAARAVEPGAADLLTLESGLTALRERLEDEERQRLEHERRERERREAEQRAREEQEKAEQLARAQRAEAERRERAAREEAERRARAEREEAERRAREERDKAERRAREEREEAERRARAEREEAERLAREQKIDKAVAKARRKSSPAAALALLRPAFELNPERKDVAALIQEYEAAEAAAQSAAAVEAAAPAARRIGPAHVAAAAAVVLVVAGGWWLATRDNSEPVPSTSTAPVTQPTGPVNPPPQVRDTPAPAPATPAQAPEAATPEPKPVPPESSANPIPGVETELAPIRTRARRDLQSGQHASALATVERGLKVKGDDPELRRILDELLQNARKQASGARTDAVNASAQRFAAAAFDRGVQQERAAEQDAKASRHDRAVRGFWAARDAFAQALGDARTASAEEERRQLAAAQEAERKRQEAAAERSKTAAPTSSSGSASTTTPNPTTATPPPVAEPPPAMRKSTPVAPVAPPDPRPAILQTLRAYEAAWNSGSFEGVQRVRALSGDQARSLRSAFADSRYSVVIRNEVTTVTPDGRRATVECVVARTVSPRGGGGGKKFDQATVFTLEQRGGAWLIIDERAR